MAQTTKESFLRSLATAIGFLNPTAESDHPHLVSSDTYADLIDRADIWLSSNYFDDYRREDFYHLGADKVSKLDQEIRKFKSIADEVGEGPATQVQHNEGKKTLLAIQDLLKDEIQNRG